MTCIWASRLPLLFLFIMTVCGFATNSYATDLPQFTSLVQTNGPAVVNVTTTQKQKKSAEGSGIDPSTEEAFDELMKKFFGEGGAEGAEPFDFGADARGSGFILSADGYVVTNHHVIVDAEEILVKLNDRREFSAKLIGSDQRSDVALLKIEASDLPTLKIGDSNSIQVGEWVLAIGSPFGLESSATSGIVSATGRSLPTDTYVPFIQTDVAINPGNSGGPLFNLKGEVIGINSQIYSRSGGFMGVSFAIPINMAMDVIQQLKTNGRVARGWIGVYIQEVDQSLAQSFGMPKPFGALVTQVIPEGPALNKLKAGDVIVGLNDKPVSSAAVLPSMVGMVAPGKTVTLTLMRNRKQEEIELTIGELPSEEVAVPVANEEPVEEPEPVEMVEIMGMQVVPLDELLREGLGLSKGGVIVEKVVGDPAQKAGIVAGDLITLFDGTLVESPSHMKELAAAVEKGKTVAVLVQREGSARFMAMKVE